MEPSNEKEIRASVGGGSMKDLKVTEDGILEKSASGHDRMMSASIALDLAAEKRLVWKFDLHILPGKLRSHIRFMFFLRHKVSVALRS